MQAAEISFERRLLLAAALAWIAITGLGLISGGPLGHDEAAFGVAARGGGAVWMYRSAGTIELARVGLALGGAEWELRLVSLIVGLGVMFATFAVGRAAFGARAGAWAAAIISTAQPMLLHGAELLGDLPATACVLAGIAVLIGEMTRDDGPRWRLVLAAPTLAAGFYLRYGNAPVIALITVATAALWWRSILKRPLPVIVTSIAFLAALAPHAIESLRATGSLLGILEVSASMPRLAYPGEGLVTYVKWVPLCWYGGLVTPMMVAGAIAAFRPPEKWRASIFLGVVGLGQILAIGLKSHARPRYIFVGTVLLVVLGVDYVMRRYRPRRRVALGALGIAWLGVAIAAVPFQIHLARLRTPLHDAAIAIRADAKAEPCVIVAKVVTQLMWYTSCEGVLLRDPAALPKVMSARAVYVVSVPHATAAVEPIVNALGGGVRARSIATPDDDAKVWALEWPR